MSLLEYSELCTQAVLPDLVLVAVAYEDGWAFAFRAFLAISSLSCSYRFNVSGGPVISRLGFPNKPSAKSAIIIGRIGRGTRQIQPNPPTLWLGNGANADPCIHSASGGALGPASRGL